MKISAYWVLPLLLAIACPIPLLACSQPAVVSMISPLTITDKDHDRQITLVPNQNLVIKLPGTAGTGYQWQLHRNTAPQIMQPVGILRTEPLGTEEPGLTENFVFQWQALQTGSSTLEFYYVRPWAKDSPARVFQVQVQIRAPSQ